MRHVLVPIAGFARSGKDTLANAIFDTLDAREPTYSCLVVKFADELKQSLQDTFDDIGVKVDCFTEDPVEKAKLRPLLVTYGEYARSRNENVWVDKVVSRIDDFVNITVKNSEFTGSVILIPDMRYLNEYVRLRDLAIRNGWAFVPIYIERKGNGPANQAEALSIAQMAAAGCFSNAKALQVSFDDNAVDDIIQWADKFSASMSVYR